MSMQVYEMAVTAEHDLKNTSRRAVRAQATKSGRSAGGPRRLGRRMLAVIVAVLVLGMGAAGVAADDAQPQTLSLADRTIQSVHLITDYQSSLARNQSIASYFAPDAVMVMADTGEQIQGQDAIAAAMDALLHDTFAGRMSVGYQAVSGERVAVIGEFVGTQIGTFQEMEATGRAVRVPYVAVFELSGDQITTLRLDLPTTEIIRQLSTPPAIQDFGPTRDGKPY